MSLFRPIRPEFLNLPTTYDIKYNSLPRNYYNYDRETERRRYKKDYYDFRIENESRYKNRVISLPKTYQSIKTDRPDRSKPKNVAVCKPLRITEKTAKYWTTDPPEKRRKKPDEAKKNVKFSEVSGCNRKMIIDDPIVGRKVVPVRELEVSLDQMIQNGYFEKHNIPIRPMVKVGGEVRCEPVKTGKVAELNGKCLSERKDVPMPRRTRHLPQVSQYIDKVDRFRTKYTLLYKNVSLPIQ